MFRKSKEIKAKEDLAKDVEFVIPSGDNFFNHFRQNIVKASSRLDAEKVLQLSESDRFSYLIASFDTIASEALVNALIDAGYKREDGSKWKIKNWF